MKISNTVLERNITVASCVTVGLLLVGAGFYAREALAVPSFSDQTGDACSACHVGAFGPQLTAHGRQFKLEGYTDGSRSRTVPLLSKQSMV